VRDQRFDRLGCFTYSHEENTTACFEDNIPDEVKQKSREIMEIQQQISWEKNQEKVGKIFKCIFDRKKVIIS
jgi:ribosomal protein S12 methylthiotransferase